MIRFAGLDLSPTGSGAATIDLSSDGARPLIRCTRFSRPSMPRTATLDERHARQRVLAREICEWVMGPGLDSALCLALESPAYGAGFEAGAHDRSGLWWRVVGLAYGVAAQHVVEVNPSTLKAYATGNGRADKATMIAAARTRYGGTAALSHDEADALHLAGMAAHAAGVPVHMGEMSARSLKFLTHPNWPLHLLAKAVQQTTTHSRQE